MTIRIELSNETEAKLRARAAANCQSVETVAARLIEDAIGRPTLEEVFAPIRAEFAASGMTDDELGDLLERTKHDLRAQRRARFTNGLPPTP